MEDKIKRIEELVTEIRALRATNDALSAQNSLLGMQMQTKSAALEEARAAVETLRREAQTLRERERLLEKKYKNKIKQLQSEVRKGDAFKEAGNGTSKTTKVAAMCRAMEMQRQTNKMLLGFVEVLGKKMGFDEEIAASLCEIADGTDDQMIKTFIKGIAGEKKGQTILYQSIDDFENEVLK